MKPDIFSYNATPESVGVKSEWLKSLYRFLLDRQFLSHSFVVIKDGNVLSEGYFAPFKKNDLHRMYSTSKSFVATAIGLLVDEGKVRLDDQVVRFFPEYDNDALPEYTRLTTVRDLLVMESPFRDVTYSWKRDDWVNSFFTTEPTHPSGTYYHYDTSGTFILDVIVERVTGKTFLEYLYEKLLGKAGFSENAWCVNSPDGYSWGGSGVECTTLDLARLGQIYLNLGKVNGEQLLSEEWCRDAIARHSDNNFAGHMTLLAGHGYGYKIWRAARDCFAFLGMGGQLMIACPKYNVMMAATSDEQGNGTGYHLLAEAFYRFVLDNLDEYGAEPKPENPAALADLKEYTSHLACPLTFLGKEDDPFAKEVFGKTYVMRENPMQIEWFRLEKTARGGDFRFFARGEEKVISFGFGKYEIAPFPETCYWGKAIRTPSGKGYRTMSAGLWTEERKFVIRSYLIDDYFGNLTTTLAFKGDECAMLMSKTAEDFLWHYEGAGVGKTK